MNMGLIGLCARAGRLVSGTAACEQSIRAGSAHLAMLDEAASDNAKKAMRDICAHYGVTLLEVSGLGHAIGRPGRMSAVVTDRALAERVALSIPSNDMNR